MKALDIQCSYCAKKTCIMGDTSNSPEFCPSKMAPEAIENAKATLKDPEVKQMAQVVPKTWKGMGKWNRIEITMEYARLQGYERLGLAFCVGLSKEAELLTNVFLNEGFDVISVGCMCGGLSSDDVGLPEEDKIRSGVRQPMCNPIGQAAVLNEQERELNIMFGLCVGDDVLFIQHSKAPVTVLAVKDFALAHNPLGALYTAHSPYASLNTRRPKSKES